MTISHIANKTVHITIPTDVGIGRNRKQPMTQSTRGYMGIVKFILVMEKKIFIWFSLFRIWFILRVCIYLV